MSRTAHTEFAGASGAGAEKDDLPHVTRHWSLIVTCHSCTLLGSPTDPVVNAMSNKEPPMSNALLGLLRAPKAPLLQHTGVGKLNMVVPR
jgi:hypothetical protein